MQAKFGAVPIFQQRHRLGAVSTLWRTHSCVPRSHSCERLSSLIQQDVSNHRNRGQLPLLIEYIHPPDAQLPPNSQQMRPRDDLAVRNRTQIVDLQIGRSSRPPPTEIAGQTDPNRGIRQRCGHSAMHDASDIFQVVTHRALDRHTVAVPVYHSNSKQFIERHVLGDVPQIS
jgi:hypothetical protein